MRQVRSLVLTNVRLLPVGGLVRVGVDRRAQHRALAGPTGVLGAALPRHPQQLGDRGGGQQPAIGVGDGEGQGAAGRALQAQGADPGEQVTGVRSRDSQPVHRSCPRRGAGQGVEGGGDAQVGGDAGLVGTAGAA
jgi:hypothetical protein